MMVRLSKRLVLVNLVLAAVAVVLAVSLARDLSRSRPIPAPPAARRTQAAAVAKDGGEPTPADEKLGDYNVIVTKHLFNPSRSEGGPVAVAAAAPPPPKPMLLGVIVDGPKSRAYLEDASTKRVFGYQIGDSVSGGRLDKITEDKVVIVRPDGVIDVLLRDPSKPKPAAAAAGAQAPHPPAARAGNLGQPPVMPRANRRLPAEPAPPVQNPPIPQAPPSPQPPPAAEAEQ